METHRRINKGLSRSANQYDASKTPMTSAPRAASRPDTVMKRYVQRDAEPVGVVLLEVWDGDMDLVSLLSHSPLVRYEPRPRYAAYGEYEGKNIGRAVGSSLGRSDPTLEYLRS